MKNIIILVLTAFLLFAISAALSLWLQQSTATATASQNQKEKSVKKNGSKSEEEPTRVPASKTEPPSVPPAAPTTDLAAAMMALREREAQLERRAQQVQIVLQDLQEQRERFEELVRQVAQEVKAISKNLDQLTALENQRKKKQETEEFDRKNIDRLAAMFDSMEGEAAAPIIKQMADSGRLELAARILVQMKERNAARLLAELGDSALAAQLLERVRSLKFPNSSGGGGMPAGGTSAPLPRDGTGVTPAGGTAPTPNGVLDGPTRRSHPSSPSE